MERIYPCKGQQVKKFLLFKGITNDVNDIFGDGSTIATYTLNGNANDLGGVHNGTPTNVTYTTGKIEQCGVFAGNALIDVPSITSAGAFSFWFKINTAVAVCGLMSVNSKEVALAGAKLGYISGNTMNHKLTVSPGTWYHVVYNLADNTFYVNGNLLSTISTEGFEVTYRALLIGRRQYLAQFFNGLIDHVRIFNRALTQAEVTQLYNEQ